MMQQPGHLAALTMLVLGCGGNNEAEHASAHRGEEEHEDERETGHQPHEGHTEKEVHIDPEMMRDLRITTAAAAQRSAAETITVLGELTVNEDVYAEIGTPIPSRVLKVLAGPGDEVERGRPLVELHSPELGKARADYLAARARADLAGKTLDRKRTLAADRIVPARELQEAEADAARAAAETRAAQAAMGAFGPDARGGGASRIVLRSPIAGTVIERNAVRGQQSDPAKPLFRIGDLSRLWLTVHAFERDAVRLKPDVAAKVSFPALPGKSFDGKVVLIGKQVDTSSRTIPVRLEVGNLDGLLRPGMSANANIPLGEDKGTVVTVPIVAVQRAGEDWCVFIPRGETTFEVRPIGRGRELGSDVEVLSGLRAGEIVVVDGAFLLKAEIDKSQGEGGHDHGH